MSNALAVQDTPISVNGCKSIIVENATPISSLQLTKHLILFKLIIQRLDNLPALLAQDLDRQNICCDKAFQYFKDKQGVMLPYRRFVRLKVSDEQLLSIGLTLQKIYTDLDKEINVPLELLDSINFKYCCDDLCPFPECLEELHASELDLIHNWTKVEGIISWLDAGVKLELISRWYCADIGDVRRWNEKRKRQRERDRFEKYRAFQDFLDYL